MHKNADLAFAASVSAVLQSRHLGHALIGAVALAFHGVTRATLDVDFLATDRRVFELPWSEDLRLRSADVRKGESDDPLAGVIRLTSTAGSQVGIVVGKWDWEAAVLTRTVRVRLAGADVPLASLADLVLLKVAAGGYGDLSDAALLLATDRAQIIGQLETLESSLPESLRRELRKFLEETGRSA